MTEPTQAYEDWQRQVGCSGKCRYPDRRTAKAQAKAISLRARKKFDVYHCQFCGTWHLASAAEPTHLRRWSA